MNPLQWGFMRAAFLVLIFLSIQSFADPLTICSITINSHNEINAFKTHLTGPDFNFVEFVPGGPFRSENKNWFQKACESGIQCDVLVISGHFAGTFFGDHSPWSLGIQEMKAATCDRKCDGIFVHPKEVYMFGCNTLAGKMPDSRSPEEYRRVLIRDGLSPDHAEEIAAFRYSPLGATFDGTARQIFSGAERIYGFDSKSPLGYVIGPYVAKYLKSIGPEGFKENFYNLGKDLNSSFVGTVGGRKIVQASGNPNEPLPVCYLSNPSQPVTTKLQWVSEKLASERRLEYIPDIQDFLDRTAKTGHVYSRSDRSILSDIQNLTEARDSVISLLDLKTQIMLSVQIKIVRFARNLGWLSDDDGRLKLQNILFGPTPETLTAYQKEGLCTLNFQYDARAEDFSDAAWTNPNFVTGIGCLKPRDPEVLHKLWGLTETGNEVLQRAALAGLSRLGTFPADTDKIRLIRLLNSPLKNQQSLYQALGQLNNLSTEAQIELLDLLSASEFPYGSSFLSKIFKTSKVSDATVVEHLIAFLGAGSLKHQIAGAEALATIPGFSARVAPIFEDILFQDRDPLLMKHVLKNLIPQGLTHIRHQRRVAELLFTTPDLDLTLMAWTTLTSMNPSDLEFIQDVLNYSNTTTDLNRSFYALSSLQHSPFTPEMLDSLMTRLSSETQPRTQDLIQKILRRYERF